MCLSRYGGDGETEDQATDHDPSQQVFMYMYMSPRQVLCTHELPTHIPTHIISGTP